MLDPRWQERGLAALGGALGAFLLLPLLALVLSAAPADVLAGLRHPLVWPALRLSLLTTTCTLGVLLVFGTPLAWALARSEGRGARTLETLLQLPTVIPPAVAGMALLLCFGRRGLLAPLTGGAGLSLTTLAVILAEIFVAAPFYVQAAVAAFRRVDPGLLTVARTFGASPLVIFRRVATPLAAPSLLAGAAMAWARALGEFGATLMFAGNLEGRTQTLPLAIYAAMETDLRAARALSIVLLLLALALLLFVKLLGAPRMEAR